MQISVQPEDDSYTLDELARKVAKNHASAVSYTFSGDDFDDMATKLLNGEPVNTGAYLHQFSINKEAPTSWPGLLC